MTAQDEDRVVCFLCAEDVDDQFMRLVLAGKEWTCPVCGCDRTVLRRFYRTDFAKKVEVLRHARDVRRARVHKLTEQARRDGRAAALKDGALTGSDIADISERALKASGLRRTSDADAYLAVLFDVLRQHGIDIDSALQAAGLALCWWCRRPLEHLHDGEATPSDLQYIGEKR